MFIVYMFIYLNVFMYIKVIINLFINYLGIILSGDTLSI